MEKIYSPEFIPYYVDVVKKYELNDTQALVYWFVRFYTSWGTEFWFKNEQLSTILNRWPWAINLALWVLEKKKLIYRNMIILAANGSKRKIWLVNNILTTTVNSKWTTTVNSLIATKENIKENKNNIIEDSSTTANKILEYYKSKFWSNRKTHKKKVALDRIKQRLSLTPEPLIIKAIDDYFRTKEISEPMYIKPCENFFWYEPGTKIKFIEGFLDDIKEEEQLKETCLQDLSESQLKERIGSTLESVSSFKREIKDEFTKLTETEKNRFKAMFKKVEEEVLREAGIYR